MPRPHTADPVQPCWTRLGFHDRQRIALAAERMGVTPGEVMRVAIQAGLAELATGRSAPGESLIVLTPEGNRELRVTLSAEQAELEANLNAILLNYQAARAARASRPRLIEARGDLIPIEAIEDL